MNAHSSFKKARDERERQRGEGRRVLITWEAFPGEPNID